MVNVLIKCAVSAEGKVGMCRDETVRWLRPCKERSRRRDEGGEESKK